MTGAGYIVRVAPDRRQTLGHRGEEIAARHLERTGWRIVERNYRVREGEIDLIAAAARRSRSAR